jgi:hypothetical protein
MDADSTGVISQNAKGLPKELEPTSLGHSIGRWEGATLVVDTVGFNDKSWLTGFCIPYPHIEMMHVVERYRRPDLGHLLPLQSVKHSMFFGRKGRRRKRR